MSEPAQPQIDLNRMASVQMPLGLWNTVQMCLRTGSGPGINWEATNNVILTINHQLQMQLYPQAQPAAAAAFTSPYQNQNLGGGNGEDRTEHP